MKKLIWVSLLALSITACGDRIKPDEGTVGDGSATSGNESEGGAYADGIADGSGIGGSALEGGKLVSYAENAIHDANNVLFEKIVYFSYDSNSVGEDFIEMVKHHGKYLSFNTDASVRLEGHADERGTREYNVALAEQRAQAVKQLMLFEGASKDQISIISYGEEKPVSFGHDEESMSLNRRVEIVY